MVENNIGIFTMYDASSGEFYKPNENGDYPNNFTTITNWTTWMRAVAYWLRDKFDFDISSGSGKSLGLIGPRQCSATTVNGFTALLEEKIGYDNDWTEERTFGAVYIEGTEVPISPKISLQNKINEWQDYRSESPFSPCEEDGHWYYSTDGTDWIGKWLGTEIFDDENDRFDIILNHSSFNNLGLRIKYPLTTTGIKSTSTIDFSSTAGEIQTRDSTNWGGYRNLNSGAFNLTITNPGLVPIINKTYFLKREQAPFYPEAVTTGYMFKYKDSQNIRENIISRNYSHKGFVTILNGRNNDYCCGQQWYGGLLDNNNNNFNNQSYSYVNLNYADKSTKKAYQWTPDFRNNIKNECTFNYSAKNFNKIKYIKSYDNSTLLISIIDDNNCILLQFCLYKDFNGSSNLIVAEDTNYTRTISPSWKSENNKKYWNYYSSSANISINNSPSEYGNYGNIFVNSNSINNTMLNPVKKYYDVRDERIEISNIDGKWVLENYCPASDISAYGKTLYLVKLGGSSDLITENGKFLVTNLNNKLTKMIVVPFNGNYTKEVGKTDTSYLIAIPIEQEE